MSKKNKNKNVEEVVIEATEVIKEETKEEVEMEKKANIFVRGFRKVKGFFGTKVGKGVAIVSVIALGLTAAGTVIYKVFYSDGTEELVEGNGDFPEAELDADVSLEAADDIETNSDSEEN